MKAWGNWRVLHKFIFILGMFACGGDKGVDSRDAGNGPGSNLPPDQTAAFSTSDCVWQEGPSSQLTRLESQTALLGNKLYIFSGFTKGLLITAETEILDLDAGTWSMGAPIPVPVTHMGAAVVNNKVWIVGGFVGDHPGTTTTLVQVYDPITDTWSTGPELPSPRASGALVNSGNRLHYFGGLLPDRQTDLSEHLVLDPADTTSGWQPRASLLSGRNHLGAVALDGKIYAVGGQTGHDGARDDINVLEVYHPDNDRWESLTALPMDLSHFEPGIFTFENRIFLVGGRSDDLFGGEVLVYDPEQDQWQTFCDLPETLLAPVARIYDNRLLVINGGAEGVCCPVDTFRYITLTR